MDPGGIGSLRDLSNCWGKSFKSIMIRICNKTL